MLSRKVEATEERMEEALSEITKFEAPGERVVGMDILGGSTTMLGVLLLERSDSGALCFGTTMNKLRKTYARR